MFFSVPRLYRDVLSALDLAVAFFKSVVQIIKIYRAIDEPVNFEPNPVAHSIALDGRLISCRN